MWKLVVCGCAAALALGGPLRAGELDREQSPARPAAPLAKAYKAEAQTTPAASELDRESPGQAWRFRCGWGGGWGPWWGGFCGPCYSPWFSACFYTPVFSCYSPCFYGGWGGFNGGWGGGFYGGWGGRPWFRGYW
jgi:hypothetical protein